MRCRSKWCQQWFDGCLLQIEDNYWDNHNKCLNVCKTLFDNIENLWQSTSSLEAIVSPFGPLCCVEASLSAFCRHLWTVFSVWLSIAQNVWSVQWMWGSPLSLSLLSHCSPNLSVHEFLSSWVLSLWALFSSLLFSSVCSLFALLIAYRPLCHRLCQMRSRSPAVSPCQTVSVIEPRDGRPLVGLCLPAVQTCAQSIQISNIAIYMKNFLKLCPNWGPVLWLISTIGSTRNNARLSHIMTAISDKTHTICNYQFVRSVRLSPLDSCDPLYHRAI